ncbi:hypothetical protein L6164_008553 [Bauhinia variegata]|uniref:Uncharacterized protein n=1 Tax=Bauhinia variegata TaxID=167791 RepID=A0ACB9PG92_BAUVA|nr:hypothetical protein L6164_008553 [Bauhinia variegata]
MCQLVKQVFQGTKKVGDINETLLALVPKVQNPKFIQQLRPIALYNVTSKCITKVILNGVKQILGNLISPFQSSFIMRRKIQDNIIIAQEMFHSMRIMKGRKAKEDQIDHILHYLNAFCKAFSQKISAPKTHIYISKNVDETIRNRIVGKRGFSVTTNMGKC